MRKLIELCLLDAGLGSVGAEKDIGRVGVHAGGDFPQFVGGFGQWRQSRAQFRDVGDGAADAARDSNVRRQDGCSSAAVADQIQHRIGEADQRLAASAIVDLPRSTFRLSTEGSTVTACVRMSQSTSLSALPADRG